MKMLRHEPTGRIYVFNAPLSRASGMVVYEDPDFGKQEIVDEVVQENCTESETEQPQKPLDEMTREELLEVAEYESALRGDGISLVRMKKAELRAYITGEGA